MNKNTNLFKIPMSRIVALTLLDVMAIVASSFMALYLRFEFSFKEIPME